MIDFRGPEWYNILVRQKKRIIKQNVPAHITEKTSTESPKG